MPETGDELLDKVKEAITEFEKEYGQQCWFLRCRPWYNHINKKWEIDLYTKNYSMVLQYKFHRKEYKGHFITLFCGE